MQIITLLLGIIVEAFAIVLLIMEIKNYKDLRKTFTCPNCNTLQLYLRANTKCDKCKRRIKLVDKGWSHFLIHRRTEIDKQLSHATYSYKDFSKYCKIEIGLLVVIIVIISAFLIINVIGFGE